MHSPLLGSAALLLWVACPARPPRRRGGQAQGGGVLVTRTLATINSDDLVRHNDEMHVRGLDPYCGSFGASEALLAPGGAGVAAAEGGAPAYSALAAGHAPPPTTCATAVPLAAASSAKEHLQLYPDLDDR